MMGQERTVLPLLATNVFGLTGFVSALTFVVAFGIAKAITNLAAGALVDRFGRKPVLVAGVADRTSRADPDHPRPLLELDRGGQPAARREPGFHLVHDGDHEDRPRSPPSAGPRDRDQRGRRVRGGRLHGARDGVDRGRVRPPALSFPARAGLCVHGPRCFGPVRARDARPRRVRAGDGRAAARDAALARRLLAHDHARPQPLGGFAGRAREQPQRRDGLGPAPAVLRVGGPVPVRDRRARRDVPGGLGGRTGRDRRACRRDRSQAAHRRRHAAPGRARSP